MKVTLLAWSREYGGAERQLVNLARGLRRRGHDVLVFVFFPNVYVESALREADTAYRVLGVRGRWDAYRYVVRFLAEVLNRDQEVVYAFLQVPNLLTALVKLFDRKTRVVWGIRTSDLHARSDTLSGVATWLESRLSPVADLVVANSFRGRDDAIAIGFDRAAIRVIHNGIDTEAFRPDPDAGAKIRTEWGVAADEKLVGLVGRFETKKDYGTFLRAAALAALAQADLRFVCVGGRSAASRGSLLAEARRLGLADRVIWVDFRQDMPSVPESWTWYARPSVGEGFQTFSPRPSRAASHASSPMSATPLLLSATSAGLSRPEIHAPWPMRGSRRLRRSGTPRFQLEGGGESKRTTISTS